MDKFRDALNNSGKILVIGSLVCALMAGCSSGGGGETPLSTGSITGIVLSNTTGVAIAGATVTTGTSTSTTGSDGSFLLSGVPVNANAVVNISAATYMKGSKVTAVFARETTRVDTALLPVTYTATITSLATAQTISVPSSSATITLPASGLTGVAAAPSGNITVAITLLDPSSNPQIMPGDYSTSDGSKIESFGALDVSMTDATGAPLNLVPGSSSTVRIPVAAGSTPTPTMDLWYYNSTTGKWVKEGTLALGGVAPSQYYEGTVTHFSTWNADQVISTTCVTGKVVDTSGNPVGNARVDSQGQGYIGTSTAYTALDGRFSINIKADAAAIITAATAIALSNSEEVQGGAAGASCTPLTIDLTLGSTTTGSAKIKLTWGTNPGDLDSHLTGPQTDTSTRFHIYFFNDGSLTTSPFAQLDVDDVTSFGPEIITINRFTPGVYRYSVHHYSGTSTILASPARVELTLNGVTRIFTPPATSTTLGTDSVWVVLELTVDSAGGITVTPVNTYTTASTDAVARAIKGSGKPPLVGSNW